MIRRSVCLFGALCLAASLLPGVAAAHEPAPTAHQVQVGTERVVAGYKNGRQTGTKPVFVGYKKVRVAPFRETKPVYYYADIRQYEDVVTKKFIGYKSTRIPPYTKVVKVYNYETRCDLPIGCYKVRVKPFQKVVPNYNYSYIPLFEEMVTKKFIGYKKVRVAPYFESIEVFNYKNEPIWDLQPIYEQIPIYKDLLKYETHYRCPPDHNLQNNKCLHPEIAEPTPTLSPVVEPTPTATVDPDNDGGDGGCRGGQVPKIMIADGNSTVTYVDPVSSDPKPQCPAGQYTAPVENLYVVDFGDGPLFWTLEQIDEYGGNLLYGNPTWQQMSSNPVCYKPGPEKVIDLTELIIDGAKYIVEVGKVVINGVEYAITEGRKVVIAGVEHTIDVAGNLIPNWRGIIDSVLSAVSTTVEITVKAYKLTGNVLEVILCAPLVGPAAAIASVAFVSYATGNVVVGAFAGVAVSAAIDDACDKPTIVDDIEVAIYLIFNQDDRLEAKSYRIDENSKKVDITACGPTEGYVLSEVIAEIIAKLGKSKWANLKDYSITVGHELTCNKIGNTLNGAIVNDDSDTDDSSNSGSPMENGDISMGQFTRWNSQGYWITYENGPGCISLYPGLTTERLIYRCPDH